jgi:hypothetical protein
MKASLGYIFQIYIGFKKLIESLKNPISPNKPTFLGYHISRKSPDNIRDWT